MNVIETFDLTKKYDSFTAVNKLNLGVKKGELFGLLGPNGAGKTTTIYMLTTVLKPTAGTAVVSGFDIVKSHEEARRSVGIVFQDPTMDTYLNARDNLDIHGRLYGMNASERKRRISEVLELVELQDWADKLVRTFSGGMRRRLEIARGLMHEPSVLFLDEPTLGLDPQTRRHIWKYIQKLREHKVTIILTTHYMEEADYLCDRVAIMDHGRVKACATPEKLKSAVGGNVLILECSNPGKMRKAIEKSRFAGVGRMSVSENKLRVDAKDGEKLIPKIIELTHDTGISIESVEFHKPSLEDVFIHYTGRSIREEKPPAMEMRARMHAR
jgi:ABC-2 type transport system ATP-binding protein